MSKGKFTLAILPIITIFGGFCFFVKNTHSQTPQPLNVTISPPVIELIGNPGDIINTKFRLQNNSDQVLNLQITPVLLDSNNNTDAYTTNPVFTSYDAPAWVTIPDATPSARPKEWLDIPYTVTIPATAAFGHYFALEISQKDNNSLVQEGTKLQGKVLVINLLTVRKPGLMASATLTEFKADKPLVEYLPVNFITTVANSGNIHLKPRGNIFISNDHDKDIDILEINWNFSSVSPSSKRTFESTWNNGFAVIKDGKLVLNWNKLSNLRLGRYTAKALLIYDDGTRDIPLTATTSFWVVPYTAIALIILTIFIPVLLISLLIRFFIRKEAKKLASQNAKN